MPADINTQEDMENLFHRILPSKTRSISKWKRVDIQRISCEDSDLRRLSGYLSKQTSDNLISFDGFNNNIIQDGKR
jgi:hypothetical protein